MKTILGTCLLLLQAAFFSTCPCPAQSSDQEIVFIRLNEKIGYIIDPSENQICRCTPYIRPKDFRYAVLAQLPDFRVVLKIRLAKSDIYRNVNLNEAEIKQLDSLAALLPSGKSVIDVNEESVLLKEMAGKTPYRLIDYQQFKFPVLPLVAPPKPPAVNPDSIKPGIKPGTNIARTEGNTNLKLQPANPVAVPGGPRIIFMNVIDLNLVGQGSIMSVNYEHFFNVQPKVFWSAKIGIGYNQAATYNSGIFLFGGGGEPKTPPEELLTLHFQVTANLGSDEFYFELGAGGTMYTGSNPHFYPYPIVGFRVAAFNPLHIRLFCNIPLFKEDFGQIFNKGYIMFFPVGLSVGYSF